MKRKEIGDCFKDIYLYVLLISGYSYVPSWFINMEVERIYIVFIGIEIVF